MSMAPVALVTGAGRGIGRAIAMALGEAGFDIAGVVRPHAHTACGLKSLGAELAARGRQFLPVHADVADLDRHAEIFEKVIDRLGRLDAFISNAGIAPDPRLDVLEMTPDSFDRVLSVNLRGAVFLAQRVAQYLVAAAPMHIEGGRATAAAPDPGMPGRSMIFITSVSAERSSLNRAEYCVSKAGLSMAARVFADRLAPHGIRVYEVRPGIIRTDMTAGATAKYDQLIADGLVPQGRWGEPEDVARAVVSLARGEFPYSTGAVIDISGGLTIPRLR